MGQCKICGKEIADGIDICEKCQADLDNVELDLEDVDLQLEDLELPELSGDLMETDLEFVLDNPDNNLENPDIVVRDYEEPSSVQDTEEVEEAVAVEPVVAEEELESPIPNLEEMEHTEDVTAAVDELPTLDEADASLDLPLMEDLDVSLDMPAVDEKDVQAEPDILSDSVEESIGDLPDFDLNMEEQATEEVADGLGDLLGDTETLSASDDDMDLSGLLPDDLMAEVSSGESQEGEISSVGAEATPMEGTSSGLMAGLGDLGIDTDFVSPEFDLDGIGLGEDIAAADIAMMEDLPDAQEMAESAVPKPKVSFWKRIFGNVKDEKWEKQKEKEAKKEEARLAKEEAKKAKEKEMEESASSAGEGGEGDAEPQMDPKEAKKAAKLAKKEEKARRKEERKAEKLKQKELAEVEDDDEGSINRVGAAIVFVFFGGIAAFVIAGTNIFSYKSSVNRAEKYFSDDAYLEAYTELSGLDIKAKDEELYQQVETVMYVDKELNSYRNYTNIRMYPEALHSLLRGLEKYDAHIQDARDMDVAEDYEKLRNKILDELQNEYNVSEKTAYKLLAETDQATYSTQVIEIANE